jgi:protein required for attachment to host cells
MAKVTIEPAAWVLVCDGRRALFLQNTADRERPNLVVRSQREAGEIGRTHELGTDQPGRQQNRIGPTSAVEQTDWHERAEQGFARETADAVNTMVREHEIRHLVVVAPPETLSELRKSFTDETRQVISAELDKDLTKHTVDRIEEVLLH